MVNIISIDIANKSLAVSIINYNLQINNDVQKVYDDFIQYKKKFIKNNVSIGINAAEELVDTYLIMLDKIVELVSNRMSINHLSVVDIIPGEKVSDTDIIYRTDKLYKYLNNTLDPLITRLNVSNSELMFLLEYQMNANIKGNAVSNQIIFHMMKYYINDNIKLIGPSLKNKIIIGGMDAHYSTFVEKYKTLYASNKNHTKYNFLKLIEHLKSEVFIKDIKKKNMDDIADATIMSLAYVIKYHWK